MKKILTTMSNELCFLYFIGVKYFHVPYFPQLITFPKIEAGVLLSRCLKFWQFQPSVADKGVVYKKKACIVFLLVFMPFRVLVYFLLAIVTTNCRPMETISYKSGQEASIKSDLQMLWQRPKLCRYGLHHEHSPNITKCHVIFLVIFLVLTLTAKMFGDF